MHNNPAEVSQLSGTDGGLEDKHVLRLYVTGATPRSSRAVSNITRICEAYLTGRYDLEVVDIYQDPLLALEHQIIAAPTLVKLHPLPLRRIIGDLSDELQALTALGITPQVSQGG